MPPDPLEDSPDYKKNPPSSKYGYRACKSTIEVDEKTYKVDIYFVAE